MLSQTPAIVLYLFSSLILLSLVQADAQLVNRTIDDQNGDEVTGRLVEYSPTVLWAQGNGCDQCSSLPDPERTWHNGSYTPRNDTLPLTLTFKFNGTAIYLFNILQHERLTDVNITVDGATTTHYTILPDLSPDEFAYNVPVFSQSGIPYGEHTVEMSAFGPNLTLLLFDYAIYTTNMTTESTAPTEPSSAANTPTNITASPTSSSLTTSANRALILFWSDRDNSPSSSLVPSTTTVDIPVAGGLQTVNTTSVITSTAPAPPDITSDAVAGETALSSHGPKIRVIAGTVSGVAAAIVVGCLIFVIYRRKREKFKTVPFEGTSFYGGLNGGQSRERLVRGRLVFTPPPFEAYGTLNGGPSRISLLEPMSPEDPYHAHRIQALRNRLAEAQARRTSADEPGTLCTYLQTFTLRRPTAVYEDVQERRAGIVQLQEESSRRRESPTPESTITADLMQEMATLRLQVDELRRQQAMLQTPLPRYSPPPTFLTNREGSS